MVYHWLKRPRSLAIPLVILALLVIVACGPTEQPAMPGTGAAETNATMPAAGPPAQGMDKAAPTAVPQAAQPSAAGQFKLDRLIVAVSPLGWDSNYSYKVTTSGLLDKRLASEWLIDIDRETGEYIPNLATSWKMAPDGKNWTFKLREGVAWQGGPHAPAEGWGEFTGRDVRHSLYLLTFPDSSASAVGSWRRMLGVDKDDTNEDVIAKMEQTVEIVDDHTVKVHFPAAQPHLTYWFGNKGRNLLMESKARWDAIGHDGYGDATVGTGPMTFVERIEGVHVLFEAVPEHWRKSPEFREFEFRWVQEPATRLATLLTEEVHMSDIERAAVSESLARGMKVFPASKSGMFHKWYIGGQYYTEPDKLHPDDPMLNVKVRKAMNKAIDRQAIIAALLPGAVVDIGNQYGFDHVLDEAVLPGVINPAWRADWDENYGYDLEAARALMVEAGYPNGFTLEHFYNFGQAGLPEMVDIGQAMALMWEKIGIKSNLENLEFSAVRPKYRAQEIHNSIWASRGQHPAHYAIGVPVTKSTSHACQLPELDENLEKLKTVVDLKERAAIIQDSGDVMYYNYCFIQMFGLAAQFVGNPQYIKEYVFPGLIFGYLTHLEYMEMQDR